MLKKEKEGEQNFKGTTQSVQTNLQTSLSLQLHRTWRHQHLVQFKTNNLNAVISDPLNISSKHILSLITWWQQTYSTNLQASTEDVSQYVLINLTEEVKQNTLIAADAKYQL